MPKNIKIGSSW